MLSSALSQGLLILEELLKQAKQYNDTFYPTHFEKFTFNSSIWLLAQTAHQGGPINHKQSFEKGNSLPLSLENARGGGLATPEAQ